MTGITPPKLPGARQHSVVFGNAHPETTDIQHSARTGSHMKISDRKNVHNLPEEVIDQLGVDYFSSYMHTRMSLKRVNGRQGWWNPRIISTNELSQMLHKAVAGGDPVDVANYAMMIHQRGDRIQPKPTAPQHPDHDHHDHHDHYSADHGWMKNVGEQTLKIANEFMDIVVLLRDHRVQEIHRAICIDGRWLVPHPVVKNKLAPLTCDAILYWRYAR